MRRRASLLYGLVSVLERLPHEDIALLRGILDMKPGPTLETEQSIVSLHCVPVHILAADSGS